MGLYDWGNMKNSIFSESTLVSGSVFSSVFICPWHPKILWEVIKRRSAKPHHGNFTPPRISPSCPHLLRRITAYTASTLDFMAGQEYRPIACYRRTGGNPVFIAGGFSLVMDNGQPGKSKSDPCPCVPRHHGATANVATAHHGNNGNVLDEWVFSCQAATHSPL